MKTAYSFLSAAVDFPTNKSFLSNPDDLDSGLCWGLVCSLMDGYSPAGEAVQPLPAQVSKEVSDCRYLWNTLSEDVCKDNALNGLAVPFELGGNMIGRSRALWSMLRL